MACCRQATSHWFSQCWRSSMSSYGITKPQWVKGWLTSNEAIPSHHCPSPVKKFHDDVIKWKHFPRYWPFVRGIYRCPVNSPHKGQWRGALMFSLICGWINGWVNNREAGNLRRHRAHYDVTVMLWYNLVLNKQQQNTTKRERVYILGDVHMIQWALRVCRILFGQNSAVLSTGQTTIAYL